MSWGIFWFSCIIFIIIIIIIIIIGLPHIAPSVSGGDRGAVEDETTDSRSQEILPIRLIGRGDAPLPWKSRD
jgi:uncharacterized membrane protein